LWNGSRHGKNLIFLMNYFGGLKIGNAFKLARLLTSFAFAGIGWLKSYHNVINY